MKHIIIDEIEIPSGVTCTFLDNTLLCKKDSVEQKRVFNLPGIEFKINSEKITLTAKKGNKNQLKFIKSSIAHIKNMFNGLNDKFIYKMEACNVHFPMTLKVESKNLIITNFLGEKVPRKAPIMPGVEVEIKGQKITISSNDLEAAGETATNIEKATKIKNRDRRIFQDGIFIVEKPGVEK